MTPGGSSIDEEQRGNRGGETHIPVISYCGWAMGLPEPSFPKWYPEFLGKKRVGYRSSARRRPQNVVMPLSHTYT